jgi:CHAT domain-containing protein
MSGIIQVLLLAADSGGGAAGLRIDREIRRAIEASRMGRAASELRIATQLAARADDLVPALLQHEPQVVHFAGHGDEDGVFLDEGELVHTDALVALLTPSRGVRVVVLNACETLPVAKALRRVVDYTVAMETAIHDDAAIAFCGAFYAALAFGRPVPDAFGLARAAMKAHPNGRYATPHLLVRPGADERPLEGKAAPETPRDAAASFQQTNEVTDTEASGSAEIGNEARGTTTAPTTQSNRVNGLKVGGSLTVGNKLT